PKSKKVKSVVQVPLGHAAIRRRSSMAFPMRALVDELTERSVPKRGRRGGSAHAPGRTLVYWRPIAAAALFTVSFMVTVVVASRQSEAAAGFTPPPVVARAATHRTADPDDAILPVTHLDSERRYEPSEP